MMEDKNKTCKIKILINYYQVYLAHIVVDDIKIAPAALSCWFNSSYFAADLNQQ